MAARGTLGPKLAALAVGLLFACGALEAGLRLAPETISPRLLILFEPGLRERIASGRLPVKSDAAWIERDDGGPTFYILKPNTRIISIDHTETDRVSDEIGFCNPPGSYADHERIDIIALGDSFTFCHEVYDVETWPYRLGELTGRSTYNLGRPGSGLSEYLQLLRHFGLEKRPRVVVMNVYGGNDLRDAAYLAEYVSARERGEELGEVKPALPWLTHGALGRRSYGLNLLGAFASRVVARDPAEYLRAGIDFEYTLELDDGPLPFNVENRDLDEVAFARRLARSELSIEELWDPPLRRFAALSREHGFVGVITYTPSAHEAYGARTRFDDPSIQPELAALSAAQRGYLARRAPELGLLFHDFTPALQDATRRATEADLLYDARSVHYTAEGHATVARSLARFLESEGLPAVARPGGVKPRFSRRRPAL